MTRDLHKTHKFTKLRRGDLFLAIPRWSRRTGWVAVAIAAVCSTILALLVVSTALDSAKGAWAALVLLVMGTLGALAALVATESAPFDARHWSAWLQPRPMAALFVAVFIGFGTMTDALALFEPRAATESEPGAIQEGINQIKGALVPPRTDPPRIARTIRGIWGEPGCQVTYAFQVSGQALIIESALRPPNTSAWRGVATIVAMRRDVIEARMEEPDRGTAVTFAYMTNGVTERLRWHNQNRPVPLDLDRCSRPA